MKYKYSKEKAKKILEKYNKGGYAEKGVKVETLDEKIDLTEDGKVRARKTQEGKNLSYGELRERHGASPEALAFVKGGEIRRFDRHAQMDSETREEILDVLSESDTPRGLTNYLYGLYDGYDYSQTENFKKELKILKQKNSKLHQRVVNIYKKIDNYKFEKYNDNYAKGGGVRKVGNREYSTGRNWTNDHNHVNKSEKHEVNYNRKSSFFFAEGGSIENQYEGKTPKEVWNMWTLKQREHFLLDHFNHFIVSEFKGKSLIEISKLEYNNLPTRVRFELDYHVNKGQYAMGGSLDNHGLKQGDEIIKTMSGGVQKVKTKSGDIVYVNLANGYRGVTPPLPFAKGGYTNERRHVNKAQDYEVRYAKPRPNRTGYSGKRSFDDGGEVRKMQLGEPVIYKGETWEVTQKNGVVGLTSMRQGAYGSDFPFVPISKIDARREVKDFYGNEVRIPYLVEDFEEGGFMTDPTFGDFQSGVYSKGGGVDDFKTYKDFYSSKYLDKKSEIDYVNAEAYIGSYKVPNTLLKGFISNFSTTLNFFKSVTDDNGNYVKEINPKVILKSFKEAIRQWGIRSNYFDNKYNDVAISFQKMMDKLYDVQDLSEIKIKLDNSRSGNNFATGGVTKNYINRNQLNTITIKKGDKKLTYKVSDVYNGAYKLEDGGKLERMAFYVSKRNVVKVQLKDGKDVKVANGYWIKKGAKPIHTSKYDDGGEIRHEDYDDVIDMWDKLSISQRKKLLDSQEDLEEYGNHSEIAEDDWDELDDYVTDVLENNFKSKMYAGGQLEMEFLKGGKLESKIQKKVDEVNSLIEKAIDSDGDPIMVVDKSGTWEEPIIYKPVSYRNGRLYFEYYEPYSGKTKKEVVNKSNIEFDGYPMLLDIAKMYRSALKQKGDSFGGGGSLNLNFKNFTLNDLIKNLPQDVEFMWISKINSEDYVRRYSKEFNKYANKKYTISDFGKIELSKGSENIYLDIKVFEASDEAPETEYIISIYTKDNQKGLKEFTNNLIEKFAYGGKTTFKEKATAIAKNFEGKKVEPKYQKEYGKTYDKAEAKEVGNKIAGSQKAKYDSKMSGGGISNKLTLYKSNYLSTANKQVLTSKNGKNIYIYENEILYDSPDGKTKGASHRMSKLELNILPFTKLSNQKMATDGKTKRGGAMQLAKQIRKDGESWQSALKRANEQMKKK